MPAREEPSGCASELAVRLVRAGTLSPYSSSLLRVCTRKIVSYGTTESKSSVFCDYRGQCPSSRVLKQGVN
ncbi:hypothetical protein AALO_G00187980 [Alosa alosa]|uniref:Uncharacterized protein n=1 Tax=Alosa alosa TaxID=278164 RepID=A0AAV6G9B6_9TELE|nr:hypothetical protein AALO_G00187980 [Alosa alosa]